MKVSNVDFYAIRVGGANPTNILGTCSFSLDDRIHVAGVLVRKVKDEITFTFPTFSTLRGKTERTIMFTDEEDICKQLTEEIKKKNL